MTEKKEGEQRDVVDLHRRRSLLLNHPVQTIFSVPEVSTAQNEAPLTPKVDTRTPWFCLCVVSFLARTEREKERQRGKERNQGYGPVQTIYSV